MKESASRLVAATMIVIAMAMPAAALGASPPGASSCQGCHPVANDGPVLPLSTFTAEQIVTAMQAFRSGARPATVMDRVAKGFSDEEVQTIAQWYARAKTK
jgi:sulfide dehydrogenase cytochrome subunit